METASASEDRINTTIKNGKRNGKRRFKLGK
jgi:hypothetical protein